MYVKLLNQTQHTPQPIRFVRTQRGFTLIELIVGIVIFAIATVLVVNVLQPQVKKGIDPIWQVRAASLGQSLSNEILAKSFDQNSNRVGGMLRCNEPDVPCTNSSDLGPDNSENRSSFNDVDDYHGLDITGQNILNSLGSTTNIDGVNIYAGFTAQITVFYDQNVDGINDDDLDQDGNLDTGTLVANKKLILVTIITPGGESIIMASMKGNY
nr:prepilin-type N-terminal cleavage/methylation domain-containing protein [uncultured Glaciecola sp.]